MQAVIDWIIGLMETIGPAGVAIAIFVETVFPPIPSEVVLPLAGFTASLGEFSAVSALIWATVASWIGALVLYYLGLKVGVERLRNMAHKMPLVRAHDVDNAMYWFGRYNQFSILIGRVIPGVRSLISIPAGVQKMNIWVFSIYTIVGSAVWNAVLIYLGVFLGAEWEKVTQIFDKYSTVAYSVVAIIIAVLAYFAIRRSIRERRAEKAEFSEDRGNDA